MSRLSPKPHQFAFHLEFAGFGWLLTLSEKYTQAVFCQVSAALGTPQAAALPLVCACIFKRRKMPEHGHHVPAQTTSSMKEVGCHGAGTLILKIQFFIICQRVLFGYPSARPNSFLFSIFTCGFTRVSSRLIDSRDGNTTFFGVFLHLVTVVSRLATFRIFASVLVFGS